MSNLVTVTLRLMVPVDMVEYARRVAGDFANQVGADPTTVSFHTEAAFFKAKAAQPLDSYPMGKGNEVKRREWFIAEGFSPTLAAKLALRCTPTELAADRLLGRGIGDAVRTAVKEWQISRGFT